MVDQQKNDYKNQEAVTVNIIQVGLDAYVDEKLVLMAAKRLYMDNFEYSSNCMPPKNINISFMDSGYAYKGTLTMFELQIRNGKYYAYYEGWTSKISKSNP